MLKPVLFAIWVLLTSVFSFAQKEANIWYFGNGAGIDFNPIVPVPLVDGVMGTPEGCASIADPTTGQLLFYTNGNTVWNRNHFPMSNGTGLLGHISSTQSALIVPQPNSTNLFYIFTLDEAAGVNGCRYSLLDMSLAGGFGDVTVTKNELLFTPGTEKMTSTCHGNGVDFWMVTHDLAGSLFYAYQISSAGLDTIPVVSSEGASHFNFASYGLGELKASPDGSRLALCAQPSIVEVFDFNNVTGRVTNAITLPSSGTEYGCAFSPDGTKVYYTGNTNLHEVVQFDLNAATPAAIAASRTVVYSGLPNGGGGRLAMQLGRYGRIYVAVYGQGSLDVITNPNGMGGACGYVIGGFSLGGRLSIAGLPNMRSCQGTFFLDAEFGVFYADVTANSEVQLHWEAVEKASEGTYEVERSVDGAYFSRIGEVSFAGNRPETAQFDFLDRNPLPENNFYRIKIADFDGEVSFSEVVEVSPGSPLGTQVRLSPNPAQDLVELSMYVQGGQVAPWQVSIYSLTGKLVLESQFGRLSPGYNAQNLDLSSLEAGLYTLQLQCGTHREEVRLVVN